MDNTVHEAHYNYGSHLVRAYSLDTGLENIDQHGPQRQNLISTSPVTFNSDPRQNSNLQCDESTGNSGGSTRKRLGMEIGRLGRNIRQKLLYSCLDNEGNLAFLKGYTCCIVLHYAYPVDDYIPFNPSGCWETGPSQLPQQPLGF